MPNATSRLKSEERFDLKSLAGAYVVLKRMSFGQKQDRMQMAMGMAMKQEEATGNRRNRRAQTRQAEVDIKMMQRLVAEYEFAHCIVDHNLFEDDEETVKLDFSNPRSLDKLDPQVGDEINDLIADMNNFEEDGEGN